MRSLSRSSTLFVAAVTWACVVHSSPLDARAPTPDYLIIGGGTAGLTLAGRLTENPNVTVHVIEAGGDGLGNTNISDVSSDARIHAGWHTQIDWWFPSEPLEYSNGITLTPDTRGKVLGGSSAINGDVYGRGDVREYNEWATLGNPGWDAQVIMEGGFKSEHFYPPPESWDIEYDYSFHGHTGPVAASYNNPSPPIHNDIISAVVNAGGKEARDLAGGHVEGISHVTNALLLSNRTRATSATAYYFPNSYRKNFQVTLNATVAKILWSSTADGNATASGVEYIDQNNTTHTASGKKVILSGGSFGTPAILERSGVGNATFLKSLGIQSVIDLPGVGENLQEQPMAGLQFALNTTLNLTSITPYLLNMESIQTTVGPANLSTVDQLSQTPPPGLSQAQFDVSKKLLSEGVSWLEGFITAENLDPNSPTVLTWYTVNLHPRSRGSSHIVSSDGLTYPKIQYNFYQDPLDIYALLGGAQRIQQIAKTEPLAGWITGSVRPGNNVTDAAALEDWIKDHTEQGNHIIGTALMGPREDGGVVDPNLKVYGTQNVYVVDASVLPVLPGAHTIGTVYGMTEHVAELFKSQQ